MKTPGWFTDELAARGHDILAGHATRADVITELAALVSSDVLGQVIVSTWTASRIDGWLRGADAVLAADGAQAELFPGLPRELKVTPGKTKPFLAMDAHDLDMAVKLARVQAANSIDGTREWLASIEQAYDKVRPLLDGDLTVADVLGDLDDGAAAAAP